MSEAHSSMSDTSVGTSKKRRGAAPRNQLPARPRRTQKDPVDNNKPIKQEKKQEKKPVRKKMQQEDDPSRETVITDSGIVIHPDGTS
jgi:hypothetical protein